MRKNFKKILWLSSVMIFGAAYIVLSQNYVPKDVDRCLTCHNKNYGPTEQYQHPLIREGECRACHSTYNEESHQEEVKPVDKKCAECHSQYELGRSHPIGSGVIDKNTNDDMTCVSTCHSPHGSDFKYQLPFKNSMNLCLSCHDF